MDNLIEPKKPEVPQGAAYSFWLMLLGFPIGIVLAVILMSADIINGFFPPILVVIVMSVIGFAIGNVRFERYKKSDEYNAYQDASKKYSSDKDDYKREICNIVKANRIKYELPILDDDYKVITYLRGHPELNSKFSSVIVWINDNILNLVDSDLGLECKGGVKIPLSNIKSYIRKGDFRTEMRITGGGGGGSSIKGAVIGDVIAGPAGAIIGSRKKTEAIKTENVVIDERETIVQIHYNDERKFLFFDSKTYDVLLKIMPEKEISFAD